ncbi:uncharacterized protein LOC111274211 [Durio zibethinus]|uniref:Uncharacterized protein LOC111274211 n=1 Tax=Durio zibethinus TaxID=66656 RepID=A0A6P5WEX2_DURZI|nr:uncharacterized protein LOC111274211 [Durio zibethinus]
MGFNNQTLKQFFAFLLILFAFFLISSSFPASCNEILPKINTHDPSNQPAAAYRVLRVKNTTPVFLNKPEFDKKRKRKMMKRRKFNKNNFKTRPFFVMLPKGFVPPSGSSPCHNDKPDSSVAHDLICGPSTTTAKP